MNITSHSESCKVVCGVTTGKEQQTIRVGEEERALADFIIGLTIKRNCRVREHARWCERAGEQSLYLLDYLIQFECLSLQPN